MEIVADTSVVIAVILNEPQKAQLIQSTLGVDLVAPASIDWEIGNAMSAMFRQRRLTKEQALAALVEYDKIQIRRVAVALSAAVELAADLSIYAYDAYMLECARSSGAPLLTLDTKLEAAAAKAGVAVVKVQP
jgi:predicted nucleic acid-binding protein